LLITECGCGLSGCAGTGNKPDAKYYCTQTDRLTIHQTTMVTWRYLSFSRWRKS